MHRYIAVAIALIALPALAAEPATTEPLPAWELPHERGLPGKADEWDDYRATHPDWFGVTAPPVVPIRPFAEYEPTQAVMLRPSKSISKFHKGIIKGLKGHVDAIVLLHVPEQLDALTGQVADLGIEAAAELIDVGEINANWTRDYGPLSVVSQDGRIGFVDFRYYHGRAYDDAVPAKVAEAWDIQVFRPSLSFEGGNFMADPHGTCYATQKLFNQNGGYSPQQVEEWMREYMGCTQLVIVKLPNGLGTGHIDMFAKLMDDTHILLGDYDEELRPDNHLILEENLAILESVVTESGEGLVIQRLPLPWDDSKVWYTYTNSLIVNDVVLIPVFDGFDDLEAEALAAYEAAAPHLAPVTINSDAIIPAGGAIHCVTMTVPEGKLVPFQPSVTLLCPDHELKSCGGLDALCANVPYEGRCDGETLAYCGPDGYPHDLPCDGCCGFDPQGLDGAGWADCLPVQSCQGCIDECAQGDVGCSYLATHAWVCELADTGCWERRYDRCPGTTECHDETATCVEPHCDDGPCPLPCGDCEPGQRRCSNEGLVEVCLADDDGCGAFAPQPACDPGLVCLDGVCLEPLPEPVYEDVLSADTEPPAKKKKSNGCAAGTAGAAWPLLAMIVGLWVARRMRTRHP